MGTACYNRPLSRTLSDDGTIETWAGKFRKLLAQVPHFPRTIKLVWTVARGWTISWIFLLLVQGILPVATVYLLKILVNSVASIVGGKAQTGEIERTLMLVGLMAALQVFGEFLRVAVGWVRATQSELVRDYINGLIHKKSIAVDLAFYESPEFYDHLYRARVEGAFRPIILLESTGSLLQNSITLIAMAGVLIPFGWWLPVVLLLSTLPALYVVLRYTNRQHEWQLRVTGEERRSWYYSSVLTERETAAEIRIFNLGEYFSSAYQSLRERLRIERLKLLRDQSVAELFAGATGYVLSGGSIAVMVWKATKGMLSLGDLALFYQAFHQGQRLMRSLLENLKQVHANSLFLGNLYEFLELESRILSPSTPLRTPQAVQKSIRFRDISFQYPGSQRLILKNFNLDIAAGSVVAIVGANGAGKSTLIKLLCRLYDPESGRIELDGEDIRDFKVEDLRRTITVLFQEPIHYNSTVFDNISFSDLESRPDLQRVEGAAERAGAEELIAKLPKNYQTVLGKWFPGGTELSLGEWQRISLARAFLREAPIILLDEPTSAMDSWAEADWMRRFRTLAGGRTALIITHRFTTAMQADVIHVMQNGQIIETGRHEELLAFNGEYAWSWMMQTRNPNAAGDANKDNGRQI
jgi:ATP-binding cassette, subfamily B, bacterial